MPPTASHTQDGQLHLWCVRYRAAATAVELYYLAAEVYSCSRTATASAVTEPLCGAVLFAIVYSLSQKLLRLRGFRLIAVNRQGIVSIRQPFRTFM